jgi:hypothetical protein
MTHVSRPLIGLLVGAVLFFALWIVALKPSSNGSTGGGPSGLGQYQSDINRAKNSVALQDHQSATAGNIPGSSTTPGAATTAPATNSTPASAKTPASTKAPATTVGTVTKAPVKAASHPHATPTHKSHVVVVHKAVIHPPSARQGLNAVVTALREHKVLAILFYNPAAVDDRAVKHELNSISTYKGRVVKLAVPVSQLSRYTAITTQVEISTTPTLVLVNRSLQATMITGFASQFEIATLVATAVETK